jgi:Cu/Ag efflux protein CusF
VKRNNGVMKKMMISLLLLCSVLAAQAAENPQQKLQVKTPSAKQDLTNGVLRKVNKVQSTLIIQHEEIKSLGMPAMTMLFNVKDPSILSGLKAGDHIQFKAIESKGTLIVTWIQLK